MLHERRARLTDYISHEKSTIPRVSDKKYVKNIMCKIALFNVSGPPMLKSAFPCASLLQCLPEFIVSG